MDATGLGYTPSIGFCEPRSELSSILMQLFEQFKDTNPHRELLLIIIRYIGTNFAYVNFVYMVSQQQTNI
jgi:hypothetical protein